MTYQCQGIQPLGIALRFQHQSQLVYLGLLLGCQMPRVAGQINGRDGWEVIVVILGVELHGKVRFGHVCPAAVGKIGMEKGCYGVWERKVGRVGKYAFS